MRLALAPALMALGLSCSEQAPIVPIAEPLPIPPPSPPAPPTPALLQAVAQPRPSHLPRCATEVAVDHGNLVVRDAAGREAQLTSSGRGAEPSLSLDGQWVVYLHDREGASESTRDLYRIPVNGGTPELVLADDPSIQLDAFGSLRLHAMSRPELTLDGTRVLFGLVAGSQVACAVSLSTKKARLIASSWGWMVIPRGPFRGELLVQQSDACHVVSTRTGKSLRRVTCDQARSVGDDPSVNKTLGF